MRAQQGTQMLDGEFMGRNLFATANAPDSFVSKAIFWASMMSPATRRPAGTKHQPTLGQPAASISCTLDMVP